MSYVELQVTTNFSFLRGASHPEEIVQGEELHIKRVAAPLVRHGRPQRYPVHVFALH